MTWGIGFVRQLLEEAGKRAVVMPVGQAPPPAESDETIQITFGYGPMVEGHETVASRRRETVVFLDSTANVMSELLSGGTDPVLAARTMTATLAPLGPILSEKQVLLVDRALAANLSAARGAIASLLSLALPLPTGSPPAAPPPTPVPGLPLEGQALSLHRQTLVPLSDLVTGVASRPIVWPLACFYSGNHLGELAPPVFDVIGNARVLYYGPYFHLPQGAWRADIQMVAGGNAPDTTFGVDVMAATQSVLARRKFRPPQDGLFELSIPFTVERVWERIEIRIWLLRSAMEGYIGLQHASLHAVEGSSDP